MLRSAANKVMRVGRATVFLIGLARILALLFWVASAALRAGGAPSVLGEPGQGPGSRDRSRATPGAAGLRPRQRRGNPAFDPTRSKGVNNDVTVEGFDSRYCFELTFKPKVAVGSPFINNNATVATATPPDNFSSIGCPEGYREAVVRTFAANTSAEAPVSSKIIFR